jgi:di-heme cytochrome c peroxidase
LNSQAGFLTRDPAKFPPNCSVKLTDQKAKAASPVLRHWELKPPSHPNAPLEERLLVYSTSRIVANPTTERSVMKHMSDLGLEDSPRATQAVIGLPADVWESLIPKDNPMIAEKVSLGEKVYFDKRLSTDRTVSCGACHYPATALPRQKHNRHRHRAEERRP